MKKSVHKGVAPESDKDDFSPNPVALANDSDSHSNLLDGQVRGNNDRLNRLGASAYRGIRKGTIGYITVATTADLGSGCSLLLQLWLQLHGYGDCGSLRQQAR